MDNSNLDQGDTGADCVSCFDFEAVSHTHTLMSSQQPHGLLRSSRARTYDLFNPGSGDTWGIRIDWAIMTLIAVNVTAVILGTVDPLYAQYE